MALTRDAIQKANDLTAEKVDVPEWAPPGSKPEEAYVYVRSLTGAQRDRWELSLEAAKEGDLSEMQFRSTLVAMATVDGDGNRIFSDDDVAWLGAKNSKPLSRLFDMIVEISGLKKDIKELEKNSVGGQSDNSGSA